MLLPQPVRCTTSTRCLRTAATRIASHWPSRKDLSCPSIWRRSDSALARSMRTQTYTSGGRLIIKPAHFEWTLGRWAAARYRPYIRILHLRNGVSCPSLSSFPTRTTRHIADIFPQRACPKTRSRTSDILNNRRRSCRVLIA